MLSRVTGIPLAALVVLAACGRSTTSSPTLEAALTTTLGGFRAEQAGKPGFTIPGAVAGVWRPSQAMLLVPSGQADVERSVALKPDDVFHLGSITKTFTAALILQLDQEKKLSVDDKLATFVAFPNGEAITLRMLLSHTSGVPSFTEGSLADKFEALLDLNDAPSPQELMDLVIEAKASAFAPGEKYAYSNSNYTLLGMIAEKVTGRTWHQEVRSRFLDKLALKHTYVYGKETGPETIKGYTPCANTACDTFAVTPAGVGKSWKAAWAAGAMISSAEDVATWFQALVGGDLLDASHRQLMQTPTAQSETWAKTLSSEYSFVKGVGLGLVKYSIDDVGEGWGHDGQISGFSNIGAHFPSAPIGVSILTNLVSSDVSTGLKRVVTTVGTDGQ